MHLLNRVDSDTTVSVLHEQRTQPAYSGSNIIETARTCFTY